MSTHETDSARDTGNGNESEQTKKKRLSDKQETEAWFEWRKWCSVVRVLEPFTIDERRTLHWEDNLKPAARSLYYNFLMHQIFNQANNLAKIWLKGISLSDQGRKRNDESDGDQFYDGDYESEENSDPSDTNEEEKNISANNGDIQSDPRLSFISYFDCFMTSVREKKKKEKEEKNEKEKKPLKPKKVPKDAIFKKVEDDPEHPLAIINGYIFGSKKSGKPGIIKDVVKAYLLDFYSVYQHKGRITSSNSYYDAVEGSGNSESQEDKGQTWEDVLSNPQKDDFQIRESVKEIYEEVFPPTETDAKKKQDQRIEKIILCVLFFTDGQGAIHNTLPILGNISDQEASRRKYSVFAKLKKLISDNDNAVIKEIIHLIIPEFRDNNKNGKEKAVIEYLAMLEDRDANRKDASMSPAATRKGTEA